MQNVATMSREQLNKFENAILKGDAYNAMRNQLCLSAVLGKVGVIAEYERLLEECKDNLARLIQLARALNYNGWAFHYKALEQRDSKMAFALGDMAEFCFDLEAELNRWAKANLESDNLVYYNLAK